MANEILSRDQNHVTVLGGVTDDVNQFITMLRVDPTSKRLLISAISGGSGQVLTPTGTVNGTNNIFTVPAGTIITSIVVDGLERYSGFGYTYSDPTITIDPLAPPVQYIRVMTASVTSAGQVTSIIAGTNITVDSTDPRNPIISSTAISNTGYQAPLSGGLTGTNTWTTAPNVIVVDGVPKQKTSTDGTVNWTGTTTTVLSVAPTYDVFSSA